jgi:hypothetical protein
MHGKVCPILGGSCYMSIAYDPEQTTSPLTPTSPSIGNKQPLTPRGRHLNSGPSTTVLPHLPQYSLAPTLLILTRTNEKGRIVHRPAGLGHSRLASADADPVPPITRPLLSHNPLICQDHEQFCSNDEVRLRPGRSNPEGPRPSPPTGAVVSREITSDGLKFKTRGTNHKGFVFHLSKYNLRLSQRFLFRPYLYIMCCTVLVLGKT